MLRFVFVVFMASLFAPNYSFMLGFENGEVPSYKFFQDICKSACNFESRIFFDDSFPPFICGVCKIKGIIPETQSPSKPSSVKPTAPTSGTTATTPATASETTTPTTASETTAPTTVALTSTGEPTTQAPA